MAADKKFEFRDGAFYNRVSGERIPDDEPVMLFRARDIHALDTIRYYCSLAADEHHGKAIRERIDEFTAFANSHPKQMKEPGITRAIVLEADKPKGHNIEIEKLHEWAKEGELCRDTHGCVNPYPPNTIQSHMHMSGWLKRDLQLALARANFRYREVQINLGTITREGIEGGYPFERHTKLIHKLDIKIGGV